MALTQIAPQEAHVTWDRRHGRPADVRVGSRRLLVTRLDGVRDETAAFPADRGPRITLRIGTDQGPASRVFDRRRRRWFVEAVDQVA